MQITLNEDEIKTAIRLHVLSQLAIRDDQEIEIDLRAGRGDNGFTATLDVKARNQCDAAAPEAPAPTPKATAKKVAAEGLKKEMEDLKKEIFSPKDKAKDSAPSQKKADPEPVSEEKQADEQATTEEAEPGVPDQETPEEEGKREDAEAAAEAISTPVQTKSIFAFAANKKTA